MAEYNLGRSGGDFSDLTRRAQEATGSIDEINRKEQQYRSTQEQSAQAAAASASVRGDVAASTSDMVGALERSSAALAAETAAVNLSNAALARNVELRRQLGATPGIVSGGGGTSSFITGVEEDPNARARLSAAYQAQAAAEQGQKAAAASYTAAVRPGSSVTADDAALLLQQREELSRQVQVAKQETTAAQASVAAQEQLTSQREAARQQQAQINAALQAERAAQEQAAVEARAQAAAAAELAVNARAQAALPAGSSRSPLLLEEGGLFQMGRARAINTYPPLLGGPSEPTSLSGSAAAEQAGRNAAAVERLGVAQRGANAEFQAAGAIYADSSNALSRHGALTTEFIQALARGDVTLRDFSSQMVSTIGKFGGWAVAGAAVYGVFGAFKDLTEGATETQAAIQQLGRFIPGLGGPAGGGVGQIPSAQTALRDISTQFNVPISEVSQTMAVLARTFPTVAGAGNATRAALAVSRLDQVSPELAVQYLPALQRSFGLNRSGTDLIGIVNSLNQLQSSYGARVQEVLPALARAAPAAVAAGTDRYQLEALAALGVRAGLPGNQVGTALLRSMGTFAARGSLTLAEYGIHPQAGQYGDLITQVMSQIFQRAQEGHPFQGTELNRLAQGLGGPLLGSRSILPLLVQQNLAAQHGENLYSNLVGAAQHPRPYQEDLSAVLGTIGERFKSIGIALQNFGSTLAQAGLLTPLTGMLDVLNTVIHAFEALVSPVASLVGLFNELPGPIRDAVGVFVAFRALRWVSQTGYGTAAQQFVGRLPGLDWLQDPANQRAGVQQQLARMRNVLLPDQQRAEEGANRTLFGATQDQIIAQQRLEQYKAQAAAAVPEETGGLGLAALPLSDPRRQGYEKNVSGLTGRAEAAQQAIADAEQKVAAQATLTASMQADIAVLSDKQYSYADRAAYMEQREMVATEQLASVTEETLVARRAQMDAIRAATGAEAGGVGAAGLAAAGLAGGGVAGEAGVAEAAGGAAAGVAGLGLLARLRSGAASRVAGAASAAPAFLSSPAFPIAGLLASQLLPQGSFSGALQSGFSDALLASFFKPGLAPAAFGLGLATSPGGTFQHVAGGALAGGFLARAAAPLLGRGIAAGAGALGLDIAAPEIGIPLTIAGALFGGLGGGLFGSSSDTPPPQPSAWGVNADAQAALHAALYGGPGALGHFQKNIAEQLQTAYLGTGQSASRGQANVSSIMSQLTAQLQLYGGQSPQGRFANQALGTVISAAASLAPENPQITQQIVQTALQSRNQEISRQFQYNLSTGGSPAGAVRQAIGQTQAVVAPFSQQATQAQSDAASASQVLAGLEGEATGATGRTRQQLERKIAAQRQVVNTLQQQSQTLTAMSRLAQENASLQNQQTAEQGYQAEQQQQQAQTQLKIAQAGGNTLGQLHATLQGAQQQLQSAQSFPGLSPRARAQDVAQARTAVLQAHQQIAQQGLVALQAQGAVAEASTPLGDQSAEAAQKARDAYQQWHYMVNNRHAFDPNQIKEAWANVLSARRDAIQAASDQATQLNDLRTQIASEQAYGDPQQQASLLLAGAYRDLGLAKTPQQRLQAQANIATYQEQANQALEQHIQDTGQLSASLLPGDPVGQAAALVSSAQAALAAAHGTENIIVAQTALNNANAAYYQAVTQQQDTLYQTEEINATGNSILQARLAEARAAYDLSRARGPGEVAAAQQEAAQASVQYHEAVLSHGESVGQLYVAQDWTSPMRAARQQLIDARWQLQNARGPDERIAAETAIAAAHSQVSQAREQVIQARGGVREARASGDAERQARIAVDTAREELANAKGEAETTQAEQGLATAQHQLNQARLARIQTLAQLRETNQTGNAVAQAETALAAANRAVEVAQGPDAERAAREARAQARVQLRQARQQRVQERGDLASAQNEDPLAQARVAVETARKELDLAHGEDAKLQAEATLARAEYALHQSRVQRIDQLGALSEALAGGDAVAEAQIEVQVAEQELQAARTTSERIAAETKLAQAELSLHQAQQDRITSLGALAASQTRDPLTQLADQIAAARQVLARATTEQERISAQTNLNQLLNQYTQTVTQQTEDTINFQLQMRQITAQQAIAQLEGLLKTKDLTLQEQQQIEEQIRQLQLGGGTGEFNLAPGSIKLPTIYDVARAMGSGVAASPFGTGSVSATANSTINVFVGNDADVSKVAAAIDNATGSQLAGALRAAGLS